MRIISLSPTDRIRHAARAGAMLFGLAIVSIAIPVAHFVLVPLFLILSLVIARTEYKKRLEVLDLIVSCENCQTPVDLSARTSQDLMMKDCPQCNRQVTYRLPETAFN